MMRLFPFFPKPWSLLVLLSSILVGFNAQADKSELDGISGAEPVVVQIVEHEGIFRLTVDGLPFFVKGAGADRNLDQLPAAGANTIRTWGSDQTELSLDMAHTLGLKVIAGLWIEHERHGFDYNDADAVQQQIEAHKAAVLKFKDHPALLMWMVGNEVEHQSTQDGVWDTVEAVAAFIKEVDGKHPVGTVTTHPDAAVIETIVERCPSLDIMGCNSYAGLPAVQSTIEASLWKGPYLVTEWGPDGSWEVGHTTWGAEIEPTSSEKAEHHLLRYKHILEARDRCLGSCVFFWGQKQETTSTWYGIFTKEGRHTEVFDVMSYVWGSRFPAERAPRIAKLRLDGFVPESSLKVESGSALEASFLLSRGEYESVSVVWELYQESSDKRTGGDAEQEPELVPVVFDSPNRPDVVHFVAPKDPGAYRLYLAVRGAGDSVATANFPFKVAVP